MFRTIKQARVSEDTFLVGGEQIRNHFEREEVERMLEKREKDSYEKGYTEGHNKGFAEGEERVRDEAQIEVERRVKPVEEMIKELDSLKDKLLLESQKDIVELSMAIAAKIIHREAKETDVITNTVLEAINLASDKHSVTIRLNPVDVAVIESSKTTFLETIRNLKTINIVEDEDIIQGGCVIETADGSIDARLDRQIEEIRKVLLGG